MGVNVDLFKTATASRMFLRPVGHGQGSSTKEKDKPHRGSLTVSGRETPFSRRENIGELEFSVNRQSGAGGPSTGFFIWFTGLG